MIYLDNASTTHIKPRTVVKQTKLGLTKYSVNAGRGGYKLSIVGGEKVLEARLNLANLFNCPSPENVIFTSGCTMAINLALRGTIKFGGHIVATTLEHNSVLRTLDDLQKKYGISYTLVSPNKNGIITSTEIEKAIKTNTYLVCTIHTSNVTGATNDIESIGKLCKSRNLIYMVDIAQSAGHVIIDIQKLNINLATIAGHKGFYGPQGIGVLLINNIEVKPLITGGTGTSSENISQPTDLPEGLESGTASLANIMGLDAGVKFVRKNFTKIQTKIDNLINYLLPRLKNIKNIKVYSTINHAGVVAFNINNIPSSTIADILSNEFKICVRSGLQCAPMVHKYNGTLRQGMVRVSIGYFNSLRQIKKLIKALEIIANKT